VRLANTGTTAIFINQLREKIGVMFGSPETTTGGKALKFYASVRIDVRRIETLKDGTDAVGNRTRAKIVKNKVAPPFKQAEFDIIYGVGISREGSLVDMGVEHGIVRKSGAWYTYEGDQLGQARRTRGRSSRQPRPRRRDREAGQGEARASGRWSTPTCRRPCRRPLARGLRRAVRRRSSPRGAPGRPSRRSRRQGPRGQLPREARAPRAVRSDPVAVARPDLPPPA
jgi:hypothetical protein